MNFVKDMDTLLDSNNFKIDKEAVRNDKEINDSGNDPDIVKPSSMTNPSSVVTLAVSTPNSDVQISNSSTLGIPSRFPIKGALSDSVKSAGNGCIFKDQNSVLDIFEPAD